MYPRVGEPAAHAGQLNMLHSVPESGGAAGAVASKIYFRPLPMTADCSTANFTRVRSLQLLVSTFRQLRTLSDMCIIHH